RGRKKRKETQKGERCIGGESWACLQGAVSLFGDRLAIMRTRRPKKNPDERVNSSFLFQSSSLGIPSPKLQLRRSLTAPAKRSFADNRAQAGAWARAATC